jgi:hypothetical protein
MKKVILAIACIVLMAFTKRNSINLTDYRDAYVGNYTSNRIFTHSNDAVTGLVSSVTTYTVTVQKGSADSTLVIGISEGNFTLKLKSTDLVDDQKGPRTWGKFLLLIVFILTLYQDVAL